MDERDEQLSNASPSIREKWESDSNLTVESDVQSLKQLRSRASTEEGMQIEESDEQPENDPP
jgi:hypothetical protein